MEILSTCPPSALTTGTPRTPTYCKPSCERTQVPTRGKLGCSPATSTRSPNTKQAGREASTADLAAYGRSSHPSRPTEAPP
jgi:hypothetical protein